MMATGCRLGLRVLVCIDIASFARYAGLYGGVLRLPTARGLAVGYTLSPADAGLYGGVLGLPHDSRTRRGLHAVARYAGSYGGVLRLPTARGLAVGYTLSPATRACTEACFAYPRLADSPWATRCRPLRGLVRRRASL